MTYQTTYGKGAIDDIARAPETPGTPLGATTPNQGQMVNFLLESVLELKTRLGEPTSPANGSALKRLSNLESGTWAPLDSPHFTGTVSGVTAAMVGLDNVNNTSDSNKPVSTAQQAALNSKANIASPTFTGTVSGITAGMVGAPSGSGTSTGTNTGDETQSSILSKLSIVSISGVNTGDETNASIKSKLDISTLSGSNTGDETATSIGTLISGATEKPTPIDADELSIWDSVSGLLKKWSVANFKTWLQSLLYGLGFPQCIFTNAIPFFLLPGDGGTNGLTFTGGGGGAFTLSEAPMANLLGGLSGRGCYGYLPANAGNSGCAAGWYYFIPSSDTAGTFYNDQYTGGQPQIVGSPTTFAGSPSGRITTPTSEITAISGINMTPFGNNGEAEWKIGTAGDSVSSNKFFRLRLGGTIALGNTPTTSPVSEMLLSLRNAGAQNIQVASRITASAVGGIGASNYSLNGNFTAIDLSGATTAIMMTMQLASNTGCMVLLSSSVTQKYRP